MNAVDENAGRCPPGRRTADVPGSDIELAYGLMALSIMLFTWGRSAILARRSTRRPF